MTNTPTHPDREHHAFIGAAKVIAACTMLSRVLGMVRDIMMAVYFGAGVVSDAFLTAWRIPNLFRHLFGEGAASSALVPTFTQSLKTQSREHTHELFNVTFTAMFLLLVAITLIIEGVVQGLLAWGEYSDRTTLLLEYTALMMPYMVLICLSAFFMAVLNAHKHFFAPAMMPVVLNVLWIAVLWVLTLLVPDRALGGRWLSVTVLVGGGLQLFFQVPFALRYGVRIGPSTMFAHPEFRQVLRLWFPVIIGSAVVQINGLVDAGLAYFLVDYTGAPSHLYFGHRMMHLPVALIGIAISTAVLPTLSEHAVTGEGDRFKRSLMTALRFAMFLSIPASVGLVVLSRPMIEVMFRHGRFSDASAARTALVLVCYGVGVWAQTGVFVLLRAFYARKNTQTPLHVATAAVVLNIVLNLTFIWFLDEAGLALATSLSGVAQLVALWWLLRRRLGPLGGRVAAVSAMKTLAASIVMAAIIWTAYRTFWPADARTAVRIGALMAILVLGTAVFFAGTWALRMKELGMLLGGRKSASGDE